MNYKLLSCMMILIPITIMANERDARKKYAQMTLEQVAQGWGATELEEELPLVFQGDVPAYSGPSILPMPAVRPQLHEDDASSDNPSDDGEGDDTDPYEQDGQSTNPYDQEGWDPYVDPAGESLFDPGFLLSGAQEPQQQVQDVSANPSVALVLVPIACRVQRCDIHCMTYDELAQHMLAAHDIITDPQGTMLLTRLKNY